MNPTRLRIVLLLLAGLGVSGSLAQSGDNAEYSRQGADSCLACHDDEVTLAIFRTPHAVPSDSRAPFGHGQLQCEACHGPGGAHSGRVRRGQERPSIPHFGADSVSSISEQNGMCLGCHGQQIGTGWHNDAHPADEVACVDCHQSHVARDPVLATASQPQVCFDCHRLQQSQARRAFAHPMADGKMDCTGCHAMHGDTVASSLVRETLNATCEQCHAEKRGPYLWPHAPVSEDCGLCHAPHGSNHPGMLTRRGPLLCQGCHLQSGHPSVALTADGLASGVPSRLLLGQNCMNCHSQVHGSNHPSGSKLMR